MEREELFGKEMEELCASMFIYIPVYVTYFPSPSAIHVERTYFFFAPSVYILSVRRFLLLKPRDSYSISSSSGCRAATCTRTHS